MYVCELFVRKFYFERLIDDVYYLLLLTMLCHGLESIAWCDYKTSVWQQVLFSYETETVPVSVWEEERIFVVVVFLSEFQT